MKHLSFRENPKCTYVERVELQLIHVVCEHYLGSAHKEWLK